MPLTRMPFLLLGLAALAPMGCIPGINLFDPAATGLVAGVSAKAEDVAQQVGGENGFGGMLMEGYRGHFGPMMGFRTLADLADENSQLSVRFHNDSEEDCTFHLVYTAGYLDLEEQTLDVSVPAGQTVDATIPCADILGLGSLTEVGEVACEWQDGQAFDNSMCVPGFLNADYTCDGQFECYLGPDEDDLDGDGDTEEMMVTTQALHQHMGPGMMMGHGMGMGG